MAAGRDASSRRRQLCRAERLNVLVGIRGAACMVDTAMRSGLGVDAAFFRGSRPGRLWCASWRPAMPSVQGLPRRASGCAAENFSPNPQNQPSPSQGSDDQCCIGSGTKAVPSLHAVPRVSYTTFRTGMAFFTAMLLSILMGPWLIARLRKFQIRAYSRGRAQIAPQKSGTPTMGGLLIGASIVFSVRHYGRICGRRLSG